jgi:hypothetical protein
MACRLISGLALFLVIALSPPVLSARDIVYSARYYYPPHVRATSHYHIYRIDPNGRHRIQLTFGLYDDYNPEWSPDGRYILFYRSTYDDGTGPFIVMDAGGHRILKISYKGYSADSWAPTSNAIYLDSDFRNAERMVDRLTADLHGRILRKQRVSFENYCQVSPNGRYTLNGQDIVDNASNHIKCSLPTDYDAEGWASNSLVAGLSTITDKHDNPTGRYRFTYANLDGHESAPIVLTEPEEYKSDPNENYSYGEEFTKLMAWPPKRGTFIAWKDWYRGYSGLFYIDPSKGAMRLFGAAEYMAWAPNYLTACVAPYEQTSPYQRRRDGSERTVWTAPLQIINEETGTTKTIQSGLIDIQGIDWRFGDAVPD